METPTITASSYLSSTSSAADLMLGRAFVGNQVAQPLGMDLAKLGLGQQQVFNPQPAKATMTARIVKVFIADSNENLPLDKRVLYTGEEKLTDLTDQELFFEVPMAELLAKHNDYRKTVVDKKQAEKFGRDIFMEPARIRDLKMVVVNVAQF